MARERIRWTPKAREEVIAWRASPGGLAPLAPMSTSEHASAPLSRSPRADRHVLLRDALTRSRAGLGAAHPFVATLEAMHAELARPAAERALDPEREAIWGACLVYADAAAFGSLAERWARAGGAELATRAMVAVERAQWLVHGRAPPDDDASSAGFMLWIGGSGYGAGRDWRFRSLRRVLATAGEDEYARAMRAAEELRRGAWLSTRAFLSFAFPERRDWAEDDLAECLARAGKELPDCAFALLASGASTSSKVSLLRAARARAGMTVGYLQTLAAMDGEPIAAGLVELYEPAAAARLASGAPGPRHRDWAHGQLVAALAMFEHEVIARAFAHLDGAHQPPKVEASWLRKHPALAIPPLRDVVARWGDGAPLAKELLRGIESARPKVKTRTTAKAETADDDPSIVRRDELAPALGAPPWRAPGGKKKVRAPKLPLSWTPLSWRPLSLVGALEGRALPPDVLDDAARMLLLSDDAPHEGLRALGAIATRESIEAFFWQAVAQWETAKGKPADGFVLRGLWIFEGPDTAERLEEKIVPWLHHGHYRRIDLAVDQLRRMGSGKALGVLGRLARLTGYPSLPRRARAALAAIGAAEGLTADDLLDRQLALEGVGAPVSLSYGARSFRVGFDAELRAFVEDEEGARLTGLPEPRASDDHDAAEAARARWSAIRERVRAEVRLLGERLEGHMLAGRRWSAQAFAELVLAHPVLSRVARSIVWGWYGADGALRRAFRIDESGGRAGIDDAPVSDPDASIGIVHPVELDAAAVTRWQQLLADYEIVPPFAQLGRPYGRCDDAAIAQRARSLRGAKVSPYAIFELERRGWAREKVYMRPVHGARRALHRGEGEVKVSIDPGFAPGDEASYGPQTILGVYGLPDEAHAIDRAELMIDLDVLAAPKHARP
jgi:hypothetical protein